MKITRKCGHREEIATNPTPEGIEYLRDMKCVDCWKAAEEKKLPALAEAREMPGCSSFKVATERKAADNRRHFMSTYAREVRPALWRATPEQRDASRAAVTKVLSNIDPAWWQLQTDPIQTLREAH